MTLDSPFPATDTEFTIALWLSTELTNDGAFHGFIGYQDGGVCPGRSPSMWVGLGETLHYDSCESGTRFQGVLQQYFPVAEVNQYQHVVWTKIGVESQFYKNGEKFGDVVAAPEHVQLSERYWIGRVDNHFSGTIDEVAIFDYGASAADVAALYTRTARCNDPRDATDRIQSPVEVFGNAWASWRSSSSGCCAALRRSVKALAIHPRSLPSTSSSQPASSSARSAALRLAAEVLADCDDGRERTRQWRRVLPRALYAALKRKFCTPGEAQDALISTGTRRIAYAAKSASALGTGRGASRKLAPSFRGCAPF